MDMSPKSREYALWKLDDGELYKALGDLRKKGIVVSISIELNLQLS
jgi:DNA-binding PadR family transcriptional regulator